jgi:hypothetical protein
VSDPTPAERSVAHADVADSADRSAALWLRSLLFGLTAAIMSAGAAFLMWNAAWLQGSLALLAAGACARRVVLARREERRVFARAVETLEGHRGS